MAKDADDLRSLYSEVYEREKRITLSLKDYLEAARDDPTLYSSAAERMVQAIGQPVHVDTSADPRKGRIFMNRT
ncbi:MAG: PrkA family serine protein kinase, partial [Planctomycetota bacterium]